MSQSASTMIKSLNNSFHTKYLNLCKAKNFLPSHEIVKNKSKLVIVADRLKIYEWQMITKALEQDNSLQSIEITSRRAVQCVREQIDTEKRCRDVCTKGEPIISTKYVFCPLVRSISNCVRQSAEITYLALEGLPLTVVYIQYVANAILQNNSLKMLSFARSNLMDDGCVIICSTIKHLSHIEKINFSHCDLTHLSASHISDLIKFQTINRYSEEWMKSFRYQNCVDSAVPPGLKCLVLNGNIELGDRGLQRIVMDLKDDEWIKAIEFQNCGLTDAGGLAVIDCLKCNKKIAVLDVNCNPKMSKRIFVEIQKMLGAEAGTFEVDRKESTIKLREAIDLLEQRLEVESTNREQANKMNIQLHDKLRKAEELKNKQEAELPPGYLLINEEVLKALHGQLEDLKLGKLDASNEHDQSPVELTHRMSDRSGFGDTSQLQSVRIYQGMSRRIQQDYADEGITTDQTEVGNMNEDQLISEDETNPFMTNNGKMKSVYTKFSITERTSTSNDDTTQSDQN